MMKKIISILLLIAAVIHLLPVSGILGQERLSMLYGLSFKEPNIQILMLHRAVLFGLLGVFLFYAAFKKHLQVVAIVIGLVSVLSFMVICWSVGDYNAQISRVLIADVIALISLLLAAILTIFSRD